MTTKIRTALIAVAAAATALTALPAAAAEPMATAGYNPANGMVCVRSRAANLDPQISVRIRPGTCRSNADWERIGVRFDLPATSALAVNRAKPGRTPIVAVADAGTVVSGS